MWNGLWKIAVMVGVVGIGLFAAYQAQKGMNLTLTKAPSESGETKDERALEPTNEKNPFDLSVEKDEPAVTSKPESETAGRSAPRRDKKRAEQKVDFFDDFADDQSQVKKPVASNDSNKTTGKTVSVKNVQRRQGLDFRKDTESFDENPTEPQQLPDDSDSLDLASKKTDKRIRQVNAESAEDPVANMTPTANVEVEIDPFADDASSGSPEPKVKAKPKSDARATIDFVDQPAASDAIDSVDETARKKRYATDAAEGSRIEIPAQPAGKARISTDFNPDSDPPKSKRARQNAGRRAETRVETESNPFETDSPPPASQQPASQPPASQSPVTSDSSPNGDFSDMGTPARIEDPLPDNPISRVEPNPAAAPRSLPDEISTMSSDDSAIPRPSPKRGRPAVPAQLSDDTNLESLNDPAPRNRDQLKRRGDREQTSAVDMVGDGVVGDVSQRGLQQPRLTIEKVAQQQAVIDQPFIYSIIVKNTGSVDAHNVVVEDRIPKGSELLGTHPQAEMLADKRLVWNHLILKPNEEKKISIKVVPKQEGPIGSVARVHFATEVSAEIVVAAPQLEFTVKAPGEVRIGQHFDMVFSLKNVGTVDANNIKVQDLVPEELKHEAGSDIECPIGKMAPQEVREIVLPVVAMKTGSVVNKAYLTADSGIRKSLDSAIDIVGEVLVLTRTGRNRLYVEKPAAFTNNIRNEGNRKAERIRVAEVVPAGMQFETASDGGKYDENLRAVVWTVGPLAPGADKSLTVNYVPKETGTLSAKITATGSAGSTAAVQSTVDVVGKPELQMETLSATGAVTVGDRITSKFQLNNTGTAVAKNVQLRVKLPRELKLISVKGAKFQQADNVVLFETIAELPPRTKTAYELVLEPMSEADAQIGLEISADHLTKPGRRVETIQIARDALK